MKVYVCVAEYKYVEQSFILGVFSSEAEAERFGNEKCCGEDSCYLHSYVNEFELDKPD